MEEQVESCRSEADGDEKAKEALKRQDFRLLAQSVALKEKAEDIKKKDITTKEKIAEYLMLNVKIDQN